jgi:hypothetical protein
LGRVAFKVVDYVFDDDSIDWPQVVWTQDVALCACVASRSQSHNNEQAQRETFHVSSDATEIMSVVLENFSLNAFSGKSLEQACEKLL